MTTAAVPPVDVLVADDQPANLVTLEAMLEDLGVRVRTAHSGLEALERARGGGLALAVLDVQMPGLDGFATAARLLEQPETRHVPVIFMTGTEFSDAHVFRGYAVGAVDYMVKPVHPDIFRSKV